MSVVKQGDTIEHALSRLGLLAGGSDAIQQFGRGHRPECVVRVPQVPVGFISVTQGWGATNHEQVNLAAVCVQDFLTPPDHMFDIPLTGAAHQDRAQWVVLHARNE